MKKTLYTMNINNYAPKIRAITYPLLKLYANKMGAEFYEITERKWPDWPIPYETFQIYDLARERGDDWVFWIDADAMIHPEMPDWTQFMNMDTVAQNGKDFSPIRWKTDKYFLRDGRHIGSCNWCAIVSSWCLDFFRPLDDLTYEEALSAIYPTINELNTVVDAPHLISDYTVSRNMARFGLKHTTIMDMEKQYFGGGSEFFWHVYTIPQEDKIDGMLVTLKRWGISSDILGWDQNTVDYMSNRFELVMKKFKKQSNFSNRIYRTSIKPIINKGAFKLRDKLDSYLKAK